MTDFAPPIRFRWMGDRFDPIGSQAARECDAHFTIGETYTLVELQKRSMASHKAYFASINEAWANLSEEQAALFPSPEHLRKFALIKAGFCDQSSIVCASNAEAIRIAAWVRPADEFSIVTASECVVTRYTAKSQSLKAMGREDFQRSKDGVLRVISELIGTTRKSLESNRAA